MSDRNCPICEACWITKEGTWEHTGGTGDDDYEKLVSVRTPVLLKPMACVETCVFCGNPTIWSCYIRVADDDYSATYRYKPPLHQNGTPYERP